MLSLLFFFSHFDSLFFRFNDSITVTDTIDKAQDKLFDYAFNLDFENQSVSKVVPSHYSSKPVFYEEKEAQDISNELKDASVCYAHYSG